MCATLPPVIPTPTLSTPPTGANPAGIPGWIIASVAMLFVALAISAIVGLIMNIRDKLSNNMKRIKLKNFVPNIRTRRNEAYNWFTRHVTSSQETEDCPYYSHIGEIEDDEQPQDSTTRHIQTKKNEAYVTTAERSGEYLYESCHYYSQIGARFSKHGVTNQDVKVTIETTENEAYGANRPSLDMDECESEDTEQTLADLYQNCTPISIESRVDNTQTNDTNDTNDVSRLTTGDVEERGTHDSRRGRGRSSSVHVQDTTGVSNEGNHYYSCINLTSNRHSNAKIAPENHNAYLESTISIEITKNEAYGMTTISSDINTQEHVYQDTENSSLNRFPTSGESTNSIQYDDGTLNEAQATGTDEKTLCEPTANIDVHDVNPETEDCEDSKYSYKDEATIVLVQESRAASDATSYGLNMKTSDENDTGRDGTDTNGEIDSNCHDEHSLNLIQHGY